MSTQLTGTAVDIMGVYNLLRENALDEELAELGKILKCETNHLRDTSAWNVARGLYTQYQTPLGFMVRSPTLDNICDKVAKKLKLRKLEGQGWERLHSLAVNAFEKLLQNMPEDEKEELLRKMWDSLSPEKKEQLNKEFNVANFNEFLHSSEFLVAHTLGIHMAREMALVTANTIARVYLGSELALTASKVLSRGAVIILGPMSLVLLALSINDLMGTNFKRIVPALMVLNIVNIRVQHPDA